MALGLLIATGCVCDCAEPGLTYLPVEGFAELAGTAYPDLDVEVCVESEPCRTYEGIQDDNQVLTIWEMPASETTPEIPDLTISLIGGDTITLNQNDFDIVTVHDSGCCSGDNHYLRLAADN